MTSPQTLDERIAKAQLLEQLLARVGYAIWQCVECEDTLAHLVVVHLRGARGVGEEVGLKLLADAQRHTFGQTLRELRNEGVLPQPLEERTAKLLDERNWVVHRAKRENRGVINRPADFDRLIARLNRIAEEATNVNKALGTELEAFVVRSGVDRADIDAEAAKLAAAWGFGAPAA